MFILYTESETESMMVAMPNIINQTPSQVENTLSGLGLNVSFTGVSQNNAAAVVTAQNIAAGDKIPMGTTVEVTLAATGAFE